MTARVKKNLIVLAALVLLLMFGCGPIERRLLFYPSHQGDGGGLTPWVKEERVIGFLRPVKEPKHVWLMTHGNAGGALGRDHVHRDARIGKSAIYDMRSSPAVFMRAMSPTTIGLVSFNLLNS